MKKTIILLVLFVSSLCFAGKDKQKSLSEFSQLLFPQPKGMNYDEGSYEAWWYVGFDKKDDFKRDPEYSTNTLCLFSLRDLSGSRLLATQKSKPAMEFNLVDTKKGHFVKFWSTIATKKGAARIAALSMSFEELGWDKASWHYFAISWKKSASTYEFIMTCDDKSQKATFKSAELKSEKGFICFGSPLASRGALDSVQLSAKALSAEERMNSYKKGLQKTSDIIFSKTGKDLLKAKKISIDAKRAKNKSTKKLKVSSKGAVLNEATSVKGKFSSKAAQLYKTKRK